METISPYVSFSKEFSKSLGKLENRLKKEKRQPDEIKEIIDIGSTLNATINTRETEGPDINHATFYDSVTTIKELAESALLDYDISELKEIEKEADQAAESAAKTMTDRKASYSILEYSSSISDLSLISGCIRDLCRSKQKWRHKKRS